MEFTKKIKELRQELESSSKFDTADIEIKNKIDKSMKENVLSKGENDSEGDFVWGMDFNHTWKNWFTRYDLF